MAAIRLDHPVLMTADQIRRREFVTTRRGYDPTQVRRYLDEVADQIDVMASMIRDAQMEADASVRASAEGHGDPYERLAERVGSVIREADQTAERLRADGARDADRMLLEARTDADRIRTDAQARAEEARADAERALNEARQTADRTISNLAVRRQAVVDQLAQMQERLLGVAHDLEETIDMPDEVAGRGDDDDPPSDEAEPVASPWVSPAERIVDVRTDEEQSIAAGGVDEPAEPPDPSYEDLWDGTETIQLDMPDIPALDLSWDDDAGTTGTL